MNPEFNMDIEDLVNEWENFNLQEKEKETHLSLDEEDWKEIISNLDHCLAGKLVSSRIISPMAIKNALKGAWKTRESFSVEIIGKNVFCFNFVSQDDRNWVFKNEPWLFDRHLLILESPKADKRTVEMEF